MKKLLLTLCLLVAATGYAQERYVFFLHNMWLELNDVDAPHPEFGRAEYHEIIAKLRKEGLTVISELRPRGTNGNAYAVKVAKQIDSLMKTGVPASHITVAGTSKGGFITMFTSGIVKNSGINYVLIGCCTGEDEVTDDNIHLFGNVLSIFEESDRFQSCQKLKAKRGNDVKQFKEIELHTGLKHGFLYKALDGWIKPTARWAKAVYE